MPRVPSLCHQVREGVQEAPTDRVRPSLPQGGPVQVAPRAENAWFQRLKQKIGYTAFKFCFQFQLAPLRQGLLAGVRDVCRASFTESREMRAHFRRELRR